MFANLPVTALRTFESAARLRSFKLAAAELAVTPTAVSHQVKALEQRVGVALFERVPRGVRLTERGASLFAGVHGALLDIAQTLDALRRAGCGRVDGLHHAFLRRAVAGAAIGAFPSGIPAIPASAGRQCAARGPAAGRQRGRGHPL